ncbi:MAG: hypothetical protein K2I77_05420, partial [Anaeroplasmataceae bacterium]|nr:hypothetical protein [Anaeroplasmataceae bacterium]
MEEVYELVSDKRLIVRKKMANFLEKAFRNYGYEFSHDAFKRVIYGEEEYQTKIEEKIKNFY